MLHNGLYAQALSAGWFAGCIKKHLDVTFFPRCHLKLCSVVMLL